MTSEVFEMRGIPNLLGAYLCLVVLLFIVCFCLYHLFYLAILFCLFTFVCFIVPL